MSAPKPRRLGSSEHQALDVFEPADEPLVIRACSAGPAVGLRSLLERFDGTITGLAVLDVLVKAAVTGPLASTVSPPPALPGWHGGGAVSGGRPLRPGRPPVGGCAVALSRQRQPY